MKKLLTGILFVFFCATISLAGDSDFGKTDKNSDGKIGKKEFTEAVTNTFNKLDINKDGFLTKEEITAIRKGEEEKFLKEIDLNSDGKISKREFIDAAGKRFKTLDKNDDGFISRKEWNEAKDNVNKNNPKLSPVGPFLIFRF